MLAVFIPGRVRKRAIRRKVEGPDFTVTHAVSLRCCGLVDMQIWRRKEIRERITANRVMIIQKIYGVMGDDGIT